MKGKGAIGVVRDDGQTRYREASVWKQGRYEERYRVVVGGGRCVHGAPPDDKFLQ